MNIYPLDISWAAATSERRHLHWELLACEQVHAVFPTARDDAFAVLFYGNRRSFDTWARTVASDDALEAAWKETLR